LLENILRKGFIMSAKHENENHTQKHITDLAARDQQLEAAVDKALRETQEEEEAKKAEATAHPTSSVHAGLEKAKGINDKIHDQLNETLEKSESIIQSGIKKVEDLLEKTSQAAENKGLNKVADAIEAVNEKIEKMTG
jgi:hypothetical protein